MSDRRDEQDEAEALDADRLDPGDFPPERPMGVGDLLAADVTAAGEYAPDDLATRIQREEPDLAPPAGGDPTGMIPGGIDDTGERGEPGDDVVDLTPGLADAVGGGSDPVDQQPAEEAALHVIDGPP